MSLIFLAGQVNCKEINLSKDIIYCVLEQTEMTSKLVYYIKEKVDNGWVLKSLITDNSCDENSIIKNNIKVHKVTEQNKLNYINQHLKLDNENTIKNIDALFIKTYKEYE